MVVRGALLKSKQSALVKRDVINRILLKGKN